MDDRDDREVRDVDEDSGTPEWPSNPMLHDSAEALYAEWADLVRGVDIEPGDDAAVATVTESLEAGADFVPATPSEIPSGALNLKCGHVGYYGILGRRQKVSDPTAIPFRWICQLIITRRDSNGKTTMVVGSGVLISPRHVLTAAHWIKWAEKERERGQWITYETTAVRVVPGRSDNDTPLGGAFAKLNMKTAAHWDPKAPNPQHNYGLLELDTALGDAALPALGGKKLCYWGSRDCPGATVRATSQGELSQLQGAGGATAGYANDRFNMQQYVSRGGITHVNPGATMRMAAHPWEGGSPVWINAGGEHQLVGLMLQSNLVVRMTKPVCDELQRWIGSPICSAAPVQSGKQELAEAQTTAADPFDPTQHPVVSDYLETLRTSDEATNEQWRSVASDSGEQFDGDQFNGEARVATEAPGREYEWAFSEASTGEPVKARILWPALGFPAVIAPGGKADAESTRCITLLVLTDQQTLTPADAARHLRCVPWGQRGKRHIAENFVAVSDVSILAPKVTFTNTNASQAQLVEFGGSGATAIRASLATAVRQRYAKELPYLHEIRISESRSAQLPKGQYQLFWNNAATVEDAPSDEMAFLLNTYARERGASRGPLWKTHQQYLLDEYAYEYGSLHRPYCSASGTRVRAEILHPLFVDPAGMPTLKIGHLTDLHVDVRNDIYEENVKAGEYQLRTKAAAKSLSSNEQALLTTLGLFNNWNKSVVSLYNDAKQDANAILLTGDLIDYGRAHWGQDTAAHLQDNDLYTADRSWFLLSYLVASGSAYTKPVYTILGNHDWRVNPYPPFAVGAPSPKNFFYKERAWKDKVEDEQNLSKWEGERGAEALRVAHGDGHGRAYSYAAKAENALQLLTENPGQTVGALVKLMAQTKTMNVKDTPAETTIDSVEWYLLSINPFLDYAFTLPNQHRVLMLDWAELENVLFPIVAKGTSYPYMVWQAGAAADPGPRAKNCLTSLQQELVTGFVKLAGRSKVIGVHAPPIGPYPDWTDRDMLEGRTKYGKDKARSARGNTDFVTKKPDGTTEPWYGHPLFATRPKNGPEGMTADYGTFENQRDWFIENVGDAKSNVRVVMSGHIHRNGAYIVHVTGSEFGPTLAGERMVYR
ncbi:MAG: metallophosphoesterase family protein, partial [Vicinamibacterales bacterium]